MMDDTDRLDAPTISFGTWLIQQQDRDGFIGDLAEAAAKDRKFPRTGDVAAARKWLQENRASGDDWEALEDAEMDYHAL